MKAAPAERQREFRQDWSDEAEAVLRELAPTGVSAGGIAAAIGERLGLTFTRSAVCGKAHRIKLTLGSGMAPAAKHKTLEARAARPKTLPRPAVATNPPLKMNPMRPAPAEYADAKAEAYRGSASRRHAFDPEHAPEGARLLKLEQLETGDCKWPLFEDGPMRFCGCRVKTFDRNGQRDVYCAPHLAMSVAKAAQ